MKRLKFFIVFLFASAICFAQDSTGAVPPISVVDLPEWLKVGIPIAYGIYEGVIRYIPTAKNYSPLGWIIKLIQIVMPNNSSTGSKHS